MTDSIMGKNKGKNMKLNMEQRKIIESKPNGHMLVKGVAGSGKTTVAVHKIPFLLKHYCPADEDRVIGVAVGVVKNRG